MRGRTVLALLLVSFLASAQAPQPAPATQPAKPAAQAAKPPATPANPPPIKLGSVLFSGSVRTRTEMWDWFEGDANNAYAFQGNIAKFAFSQTIKNFDWQLEFAAPFLLGLPDDAIAAGAQGQLGLGATYYASNDRRGRNRGMIFPKQGFVRWKGLFGDDNQSLRVGRFEFSDAAEVTPKDATVAGLKANRLSQRLIGPFGWSHTGRSFDGAHYVMNRGTLNLTLMSALPTRGAFQVDGWGNLKVGVGYAALTGQLPGKKNYGEWRAFGIYYQDWRHVLKTDNRPLALRQRDFNNIRIGTFGGHYIQKLDTSSGPLDFIAWGVLQTGTWGRLDHSGKAVDLEAGWQPKILPKLKPWFRGGFSHTSGDDDPLDGTHKTFFQILPTPRPYARMPFYDMVNNDDFFGLVTLRPHKAVTVTSEFHSLRLANRRDLWFLGGGAYQPWTFGYVGRNASGARSLANLWDTGVNWNVNAHFNFQAYYGYAVGKAVMERIYPKGKDGSFGYLELTYKF
jgi:hypothetical protein